MRFTLSTITILLVIAYGCSQPHEKDFNYKKVILKEVAIARGLDHPGVLKIHNDQIFVYDFYADYAFNIYSSADFQQKGTLVRQAIGRGNEIVVHSSFWIGGEDSLIFMTCDSVFFANLQKEDNRLSLPDYTSIKLPSELKHSTDFFILRDTLFFSNPKDYSKFDFKGFCLKNYSVFDFGEIIFTKSPKYKRELLFDAGIKHSTVKPDKSKVAIIYQATAALRIYSTLKWEIANEWYMDINPIRYFSIRSTSEFIYALFTDTQAPDLLWDGSRWRNNDVANEIHVWDWEGNFVMKLKLNRLVFSFDITPDNKKIVALSATDPKHLFVSYIPWN